MHEEQFGGGEDRKADDAERPEIQPGFDMPGMQEVPAELPADKQKFPDHIVDWPDIKEQEEDAPLPGELPTGSKKPGRNPRAPDGSRWN